MGIDLLYGYPNEWFMFWVGFGLAILISLVVVYIVRYEVLTRTKHKQDNGYIKAFNYLSMAAVALIALILVLYLGSFLGHVAAWRRFTLNTDNVFFLYRKCALIGGEDLVLRGKFEGIYCEFSNGSLRKMRGGFQ